MLDFLKSDIYTIILTGIIIVLCILYIANTLKLKKLRSSYKSFMNKLGTGKDIEEMLQQYVQRVEGVENNNKELIEYCKQLNNNFSFCLQKIGFVRYNAFEDTGSQLSFALAMLDRNNNGFIMNGIYARNGSNIYAKTVEQGKSSYRLSQEEEQALQEALNNNKS